ncbi:uncharacterized protein [Zea mays]|jgi:hypothetical protein|uniref:Uncharacterized protein n=1 Tax=Zea mays TaxID=4577 RepID=C0HHB4_MAIZE|nr:uncharacterized protein LOC118473578 [Zea mays]ACN26417.1 unknown [Zea mays]
MQQPRPPSWAFFPRRKGPTQTDEQFRSDQLAKSIYETNEETPVQPADSDATRTCPTRRPSDASRTSPHPPPANGKTRARGTSHMQSRMQMHHVVADRRRHYVEAVPRGLLVVLPATATAAAATMANGHGHGRRRALVATLGGPRRRGSACGCETRFCVPLLLALRHCGRVCITCQYCSVRPEQSERCKTTSSCE